MTMVRIDNNDIADNCSLSDEQRERGITCNGILCFKCQEARNMKKIEDGQYCPYCGNILD